MVVPKVPTNTVAKRLRAAGCVFAADEAKLLAASADGAAELEAMVSRRVAGVPLQHVIGWAEFGGVRVDVDDGVFVPRKRTEFLVREAARLLAHRSGTPLVLDLCCGSGALGVAVAEVHGLVELHAADADPAAASCARRNVAPRGGRVYEGDLYAALPRDLMGRLDVIVANVPYVPTADIALMPREARDHEPHTALDGGADGLDVARRVINGAPQWLVPGGHLLFEVSDAQASAAADAIVQCGLTCEVTTSDHDACTVMIATNAPSGVTYGG